MNEGYGRGMSVVSKKLVGQTDGKARIQRFSNSGIHKLKKL